jgi:hypothetical protein
MHENSHRISAHHISDEVSNKLYMQPDGITEMVMNAVAQYNKILPLSTNLEGKDADERLIRAAEEEADKVFLDGILDIMERKNS